MQLDVVTMMVMAAFVAVVSGVLLLVARFQYREMTPLLGWVAANFFFAGGLLRLASGLDESVVLVDGYVLLSLHPALLWTSARLLNERATPVSVVMAGPGAVLLAVLALPPQASDPIGVVHAVVAASYLATAAYAFAFQASQPLRARWALAALCLGQAAAALATIPLLYLPPAALQPFVWWALKMIQFEVLIFFIGSTIFLVAAIRESRELGHKLKAETDGLTGILNRRSFMEKAARSLRRCHQDGTPCALIVFDLDRFKVVNDTYGHAIGDMTLTMFAQTAGRDLRPGDIFGRIGGEEFAAFLPQTDLAGGLALAERIRLAFAREGRQIGRLPVGATLSAGVSAPLEAQTLESVMENADAALYLAKAAGRNRVLTSEAPRHGGAPVLAQVA
ncbi:GGDEF domain-containing protein [Afifella pfennigii]|uniref:GGDEF domain-containing protein n=1 Tax=Afifella pfennigii TaxID=209897 RepID=UPI000556C625|nr:GGDEF domain-containing protein [Afifella pfennigii]